MAMTFDMVVDYEDGSQEEIRADQRDCVAWEKTHRGIGTGKALDEQPMTFFRWISWHALKRQGRTDLPNAEWDALVVSADAVDEPGPADPGNPDRSDAGSSS